MPMLVILLHLICSMGLDAVYNLCWPFFTCVIF